MCYKYPGLRCADSSIKVSMNHARTELADTKNMIASIEDVDLSTLSPAERKNLRGQWVRAKHRKENTEARIRKLQAEYTLTTDGLDELREKLNDQSLTARQREDLRDRLEDAEELAEKRLKASQAQEAKKKNLEQVLRANGVPEDVIATIKKQESANRGNPPIRSHDDLKEQFEKAEQAKKDLKAVEAQYQEKVATVYRTATKQGWEQAKTNELVRRLDRAHTKHVERVQARFEQTRSARDAHVEGQKALEKEIAELHPNEFQQIDELTDRLRMAKKARIDGLQDREAKIVLKRQITQAMEDVGKNPALALNALKAGYKQSELGIDPAIKTYRLSVHFNDADEATRRARFEASSEYKNQGEEGYRAFTKRILVDEDPRTLHTAETVDEANANVDKFDQGKPRRHKRSAEGLATISRKVGVEERHARKIADEAKTLHMSTSSYIRARYLGINPYAIQNDRSKEVWREKTEAMKRLWNEDGTQNLRQVA